MSQEDGYQIIPRTILENFENELQLQRNLNDEEKIKVLVEAASKHRAYVELLFRHGYEEYIDRFDRGSKMNPLTRALTANTSNAFPIIDYLIQKNANVKYRVGIIESNSNTTYSYENVLHALLRCSVSIKDEIIFKRLITILLEKLDNPNSPDIYGMTPFHQLVMFSDFKFTFPETFIIDLAKKLLKKTENTESLLLSPFAIKKSEKIIEMNNIFELIHFSCNEALKKNPEAKLFIVLLDQWTALVKEVYIPVLGERADYEKIYSGTIQPLLKRLKQLSDYTKK